MIRLVEVTLESEMDLVLCNQKFIKVAEQLQLSLSTRSTFASAISEVVRVLTEHTDNGVLVIGIDEQDRRHHLVCKVFYPSEEAGIPVALFQYAKRLVPIFDTFSQEDSCCVKFSIGLPKSKNLDRDKIHKINMELGNLGPLSAYEELKNTKNILFQKAKLQNEELEASKYLNDLKSEFISMASHELKTPITILKAYGQLGLSDKIKTVDQAQSIIAKMNDQSTKLSLLALQLLDSAKIEIGQLEYEMKSTDFNCFLQHTVTDLRFLVPDHTVVTEFDCSKQIMFDALRIEQVLSNLLSNAAKYSEKNTHIYIKTEIDINQRKLILSIRDEGIGISEKGLTKIFNKFHREPEVVGKQSGLGMGMYIASQIVAAHGGAIWVTSLQKIGSTFFVTLPFE